MDYQNTFKDLMQDLGQQKSQTDNVIPANPNSVTTVYNDFRLTVTNEMFVAAGLNNAQRILVYISTNQNAVYLTTNSSLSNEFAISKILKHKPNTGLRLNVGKILNIGTVPCEAIVQIENNMIKIYPKDGLTKLPADQAFNTVCNTIEKVYGFDINQFLNRLAQDMI